MGSNFLLFCFLTFFIAYGKLNIVKRGSVYMVDLDENLRLLQSLKAKLTSIGDSLWHC